MWDRPHGNTSSHVHVRQATWQLFFPHVCETGHIATLLPTSMWGRPHGNSSSCTSLSICCATNMSVAHTECSLKPTQPNRRYGCPVMTESMASYPHKMLQRFVALLSSHPLPLTVKDIQFIGRFCLMLLRGKLLCRNAATCQWPHIRWKQLELGLTLFPLWQQSHSFVLNSVCTRRTHGVPKTG
jgi:hypothetical protein